MTPERLEGLKKMYSNAGYKYSENEYYHMFDAPSGRWCEFYSKATNNQICFDPTMKVNLRSSKDV